MNDAKPNLFIASIGLGDYIPTIYATDDGQAIQAKYVQNAIRKIFAPDAAALVFATRTALKKFFPDDHALPPLLDHRKARDGAEQDSLFRLFSQNFYQECERLGLSFPETIEIPDGKNVGELWQIFRILYERIPENARICFDPTHAFRHHPIIMTILFNYLHVMKNVDVVCCEYGAFELNMKGKALLRHVNSLLEATRGESMSAVAQEPAQEQEDRSPLFPITEFFLLNDWTNAIHDFLEYGRTIALRRLVEEKDGIISTEDKKSIQRFVNTLDRLAEYALFSNLYEIERIKYGEDILSPLQEIQRTKKGLDALPQLVPLFSRLERLLGQFRFSSAPSWRNGFAMARWCNRFKLYPQLYTILQETCVSACADVFLKPGRAFFDADELNRAKLFNDGLECRNFISVLLAIECRVLDRPHKCRWPLIPAGVKKCDGNEPRLVLGRKLLKNDAFLTLREKYAYVTKIRNAINHGFTADRDEIPEGIIQSNAEEAINGLEELFLGALSSMEDANCG